VKEARFWQPAEEAKVRCRLCPHECLINPGKVGICGQRENDGGHLFSRIYARVTSAALDPVEKKPLYHFMPGTGVLSLGSVGCNFRCSFCQNWSISQNDAATEELLPDAAVGLALRKRAASIAYTYNEPIIGLEYVIDTARLAREKGLANILVTNGFVNEAPLAEALPFIDALNVDVKSFEEDFYKKLCGGHLGPVLARCEQARRAGAHLEITYLVIPGYNDRTALYEGLSSWIAEKLGDQTPLHLSAHFPRYRLQAPATTVSTLMAAQITARRFLKHVYLGNTAGGGDNHTACAGCGAVLVERHGYEVKTPGLGPRGECAKCGAASPIIVKPRWKT
jgi:pyruvate formate lyase activating enzyme